MMPSLTTLDLHLYHSFDLFSNADPRIFKNLAMDVTFSALTNLTLRGLHLTAPALLRFFTVHARLTVLELRHIYLISGRWNPVFTLLSPTRGPLRDLHTLRLYSLRVRNGDTTIVNLADPGAVPHPPSGPPPRFGAPPRHFDTSFFYIMGMSSTCGSLAGGSWKRGWCLRGRRSGTMEENWDHERDGRMEEQRGVKWVWGRQREVGREMLPGFCGEGPWR